MTGQAVPAREIAADVRADVAREVAAIKAAHGFAPQLAVVLVGDDPASQVYVRNKEKHAAEAGLRSRVDRLSADIAQDALLDHVRALSADPDVDGVLVQLPLPRGLDEKQVIAAIDPDKDVDGLTVLSQGRLAVNAPGLRPCTPTGCLILAERTLGDLSGKHCVVLGRSELVGHPAAELFLRAHCTVTIAHSRTQDLPRVCRLGDILIAAVGRPEMVKGDWVKPGAMVIDVGINRVPAPEKGPDGVKLVGDVDFASCLETAAYVTPVPGGVGLMTVACLLRNTVDAARLRRGLPS